MTEAAARRRAADAAFWAGFVVYLLGSLFVLTQGALAVVASVSPAFHETLHIEGLGTGFWARVTTRAADASHEVPTALQIVWDYLFSFLNLGLAAVLLRLRSRDWTARLLALALVGAAGVFNLTSQAVLEWIPFTPVETFAQVAAHVIAGLAYVFALLLFPDGRPVPRWGPARILPLYAGLTLVVIFMSLRLEGESRPAILLLFFGLMVPATGAAAQAYRIFHTEDATGQAQARLLFWALLPSVGFGIVFLILHGLSPAANVLAGRNIPDPPVTLYRSFQPAFALIPLALFLGILRYRIWDIERLLNRTTVYAIATAFLTAVYAGFVVVTQLLLGNVAASPLIDSKPAVAITSFLLLTAFRPVRDRVQVFIDRRFNRSRYNAQVTVERFVEDLRHEVDLEGVVEKLDQVLYEVIQPRHLSLWVGEPTPRPPS